MEIIKEILSFINRIQGLLHVSNTGYFEHFIVGVIITGLISYLSFDSSNNWFKSIFIGIITAFAGGLLKEYIDPIIGGDKDKLDLIFTVLGGVFGAMLFLLMTYIQNKKAKLV